MTLASIKTASTIRCLNQPRGPCITLLTVPLTVSTAPAAPSRWPVAPLVEETARLRHAWSPNTAKMARCSTSSPALQLHRIACSGGSEWSPYMFP